MKIGIIGSGPIGAYLASAFVKGRHQVSIANSRGPASLKQLAGEIGAEAATVEEAIKNQQVIVVAIPTKNVPGLPKNLFNKLPQDVVVIDTGNYYPALRDGTIPSLEQSGIDSLWVQEQLGFPVVKVFNTIFATSLKAKGKPESKKDRIALAVSGDNAKAKDVVFKLVDELGFDSFDIGTIAQSWKQQPGSSIYCRDISLAELERRVAEMRTDWSEMRDIIIGQHHADEAAMATDFPTWLKGMQS
jgi:predicted dinucleotide-binding enzyme